MQQPLVHRNRSGDLKASNHDPRPGREIPSSDHDGPDKKNKEFSQRTRMAIPPSGEALNTKPASDPITDHSQKPGLTQGLQVPSRFGLTTSGFKFPKILESAGITKAVWSALTSDIKLQASLSLRQWAKSIGCGIGTFFALVFFIGGIAVVPAALVGHNLHKNRERQNMFAAYQYGSLDLCLDHWNESYFKPRGLVVRLFLPSISRDITKMDLATSRFFGNRVTTADFSVASGAAEDIVGEGRIAHRDQIKADRARRRAIRKCRIVITREIGNIDSPMEPPDSGLPGDNSNYASEPVHIDIQS